MFDATVRRLTEHVYWMKAGEPDRPSLCAVAGTRRTLMLDAGASDEHARLFLDGLAASGVRSPDWVALSHWHWDHVFGAAQTGVPVIAHRLTAAHLAVMASQAWDNGALDARVDAGEEIAFCAENIKLELPEPRAVRIAQPEIVFGDGLEIDLGGAVVQMRHVGGDHAADSCVMAVPCDGLLFVADCLYDDIYAPSRHYTAARALPLIDALLSFDASVYIEGHNPEPSGRAQFESMTSKMRLAAELVIQYRGDAAAVSGVLSERFDEDTAYYVQAFAAGYGR